jgi:hypothetical protein
VVDVPTFAPSIANPPVRLRDPRPRRSGLDQALAVGAVALFLLPLPLLVIFGNRLGPDDLRTVGKVFAAVVASATIGTPLVLPAMLSRRGVLSVARWCILGAAFAVVLLPTAILWFLMVLSPGPPTGADVGLMMGTTLVGSFCGLSLVGCLIAAAVYPKEPPR